MMGFLIQFVSLVLLVIREIKPLFESRPVQRPIPTFDHTPLPQPKEDNPMIEFQIEIERLFHKNQLIPRIKAEFENEPEIMAHVEQHQLDKGFVLSLLTQMVLHKRASLPVLVGCLRKHFIQHEDASQKTTDALLKAAEHDLVNWFPVPRQFVVRFGISADVQAEIDRYQYPLPMVVPPKELETNHDSGYLTGSSSVILRDNHHDDDVCLDHLNKVNSIQLRINQDVALTVKNTWKNLDKPKDDEDFEDYQKRVKAFDKYNKTAHDVIDHLGLAEEGEFYLTHRYDKRGRTYSQGYHVNYQGAPWNKAVIEFAQQELVN